MGSLDGKVALITGAGRGIGREEALFFAAEGARVVVNDPGVEPDGSGGDRGVAAAVAEEIVRAGGRAVADTGSVARWEDARQMVETAVEAFGDLHIVVNNAAVERNRALPKLAESDFDEVVGVKLKGTFAVSHWAARHWRERRAAGDRVDRAIVNTTSGSGLLNPLPAQTGYAAANAGVAAMTVVHALELRGWGVRVNAVSPSMVRTRLTRDVPGMPPAPADGAHDPLHPRAIAPVAAYLASPDCPFTGQVFSVRGTTVTRNQGWTAAERVTGDDAPWTVESLARALGALPRHDPFEALLTTLAAALGPAARDTLHRDIDALLT
ncbi:SDR family NAD(P)-dependent oxidoreductase [Bailinhaonella thermotolerans]|uniref:SDR family NAD(P)-dependent oxidoreductase n=1 Tax=Bailinhaonella thermotolerans TaxID=1070861 RepID=A0A3A4AFQ1_9ACTN|nr:SDR family NAD(P)-dependent oxidoreductase [Bailinhaonella thermotolerans]RJL24463.1 SDR family NAD(P)-dependent oxidoreductase [Bailinhaonella thermotolerans]